MQVQVNHDNHVHVGEQVSARLAHVIEESLVHFGDRITRVEMHLSDETGKSGAADQRCLLEARLANLQPLAVTARAEDLQRAIEGALQKLQHALRHALGKAQTH
jgi:ribosome-associated translation inhibitor RaiA